MWISDTFQEAELLSLIRQSEGITIEFKKSASEITKDVYDTVCSFSNRDGSHIFLGVRDDGVILGVNPNVAARMKEDFVTSINNAQKLYPPLYLQPEQHIINGELIF